ncbi:MAG: Dam-replacing family protein [Candidatus Moranbacteria bacterium GW2011_GWE1_35_17]|nr:MAG: Dam-replacing family protein [Candidatus Moranbacteria bacterium GW2011_GWE1_35_17]KKP67886.1 MAG: Dam-replacing family protein [Candidatus Moranbacteria bacterium GW2011_GWE2_35_164]KKP81463.1 MAG: Dam-replacing family protein [Candidatus Moranbacteria bacterium GW2011_GWF1_35_5]KKP81790.1 MAG: Dam-replacing family protein [Candidatus Moranbacteria bacterium GW2011_GWF2_35_54]
MNLNLDQSLGERYDNNSQKIRVMSESWTEKNIFCPNCGNKIKNLENNKKVSDFLCEKCFENYEQKASQKKFRGKVVSSEYKTTITRLVSLDKPNFFFMHYVINAYSVNDFFVVPKYFFVPEIIEKRKALSKTARRAGWIGSNILFSKIPSSGKIYYIENGEEISKKEILEKWQKTSFLKEEKKPERKGWILDIMNCIDALGKKEFSLQDLYTFEKELSIIHPENRNIKPKIRQQLQRLRDENYVEFSGNGNYKLS